MIRQDLINMTLKRSQPHQTTKMTQGFNEYVKSVMTFNTLVTPHKGVLHDQETDTKYRKIYKKI